MDHIELLIKRYPELEVVKKDILNAFELLKNCYKTADK